MNKIRVNMVSESDIAAQAHGVHTAYIEMASALERRRDVEVIRGAFGRTVECDVVHLQTIGSYTWRKLFQRGPKKVVSAHIVPDSFVGSIILAKYWRFAARWYMSWFYNRCDKVLAVSGTVAKILERELRVPASKIETFYNTIDMQRYRVRPGDKAKARKSLGLDAKKFIVLGNGQVQPRKRLDIFVRMAKAMPDVEFIWVGGIPFKQLGADYYSMQRLMHDNTLPNFKITGIIPHDRVRDYLAAADVFCLPAEQENHPMCVLEAAGAGLPIVLRDIPEYDDTFGQDAIRCQDDTFEAMVRRLRDETSFYRAQVKKTQAIAKRFDSNAAAAHLVDLYRSLL